MGRRRPADGSWQQLSHSTYQRCRAWWEARGYIAVVRPGWTPMLGPMALTGADAPNEAQVYVLCVPRNQTRRVSAGQLESRPVTLPRRGGVRYPARAGNPEQPKPSQTGRGKGPRRLLPWPLRGVSDGWWAHLTGPFTAAGWTPADIAKAIDYEPGGRQHRYRLAGVRHPVGWLRARLARWLGPDGTPLPSRRQQLAAAAAATRAEQAARRRQIEQLAAGRSADPGSRAAEARAMLAGRPRRLDPPPGNGTKSDINALFDKGCSRPPGLA